MNTKSGDKTIRLHTLILAVITGLVSGAARAFIAWALSH
jgi:hypothetical protein